MPYKVISGPAADMPTLEDMKTRLRISGTVHDDMIRSYISAARYYVESTAGRALSSQTIQEVFDSWPCCCEIELALCPLVSVSSIKYYDDNGAQQTFSAANYTIDTFSAPARIVKKRTVDWPTVMTSYANPIIVEYVVGESNPAIVNMGKLAIQQLVAGWYENVENAEVNEVTNRRIYSADLMINKIRSMLI